MIAASNVAAILLAAGRSKRFGTEDKLLAPLDGVPLVLHAARRIADLSTGRRIAVCGPDSAEIVELLGAFRFEIVINPDPGRGLSSSLALGIAEASQGGGEAALLCLADMPFVSVDHLQALLDRFDPQAAPAVASAAGETAMPPAVFARGLFGSLQKLEGDQGARDLLAGAARIPAGLHELTDIDRPADLPS